MLLLPDPLYAEWRAATQAGSTLYETREGVPCERLLHHVWHHQRIRHDPLVTLDGRSVRVLHPGFWNREPGPDFRRAVIQFDDEPARSGDVEIDLQARDWQVHRHHLNRAYRQVILHVVWEATASAAGLPTLVLKHQLDAPLPELLAWVEVDLQPVTSVIGRCAAVLHQLPPAVLTQLLCQAALFRLRRKALEFAALARQAGWENALWEGLFGALGYKHNAWPMRRLARRLPELLPPPAQRDVLLVQARLLGCSSLLPHDSAQAPPQTRQYLQALWNLWWRERDHFAELSLPPSLWRLAGVRPANHPQRRLALAAHWLVKGDLTARLEAWLSAAWPDQRLAAALLEALQVPTDPFWSHHWTLASGATSRGRPLLGPQRLTDLAVNTMLPWLWSRANAGHNDALRREIERRFLAWPPAQDNAVLRLARQRLVGTTVPTRPGAACQQGLLQIVRDFCGHSNALCEACPFPGHVAALVAGEIGFERRLPNLN